MLAVILPTRIPVCKRNPAMLGIANAFGGGVFIAIAFMHILPEANEDYAEICHDFLGIPEDKDCYPLPYFLYFAGYVLILLLDKVMFDTHSVMGDHGSHDDIDGHREPISHTHGNRESLLSNEEEESIKMKDQVHDPAE